MRSYADLRSIATEVRIKSDEDWYNRLEYDDQKFTDNSPTRDKWLQERSQRRATEKTNESKFPQCIEKLAKDFYDSLIIDAQRGVMHSGNVTFTGCESLSPLHPLRRNMMITSAVDNVLGVRKYKETPKVTYKTVKYQDGGMRVITKTPGYNFRDMPIIDSMVFSWE